MNNNIATSNENGSRKVSQQMMQNRIRKARMLRNTYTDLVKLTKDSSLDDSVKKILRANVNSAFEALQRAEGKVISQVEKVVTSTFEKSVDIFQLHVEMWEDDPTTTIIEDE